MIVRLPRGYEELEGVPTFAVAHQRYAAALRGLLAHGTWYEWAGAHPERREFTGRGPVYSAPLPDGGPRVVIRHARHGGFFAPLFRDLYIPPTPAPSELIISAILQAYGVPTPPVAGFATYRAARILRRVDVATLELQGSDLVTALSSASGDAERKALLPPLTTLLASLLNAGAWHQDLNARNIFITRDPAGALVAAVLDVDRVQFSPGGDPHIRDANLARLRRSLQKLGATGVPVFTDAELAEVDQQVREADASRAAQRAAAAEAGIT